MTTGPRNRVVSALFTRWTWAVHRRLLVVSAACAIGAVTGSTSFSRRHVIYITISVGLLMLCLGYRYLPGWAGPIGWAGVAAIVLTAAISRVYVGAHWPIDVSASLLIAGGWLALVTSLRWISDRALEPAKQTTPNEQPKLTVMAAVHS
jgi:membrane-associated phospholipid phosphatase